jgi:integrase/recombinase XerD
MARKSELAALPPEDLAPLIDEFTVASATIWSKATKDKHKVDFARFTAWLADTKRPQTTESLAYDTLIQYVGDLLNRPAVRGVWRGSPGSVKTARSTSGRTLSRNTVGSYMSPIRTLCTYLVDEGVIGENPFRRRGRARTQQPLLPSEETPPKSSTPDDFNAILKGIPGNEPLDLRDRAIVWLFWNTGARAGALSRLRLEDIDLDRNRLTLRRGKGNTTLEVPLISQAKVELMRFLHRGRKRLLRRYPVRGFEQEPGLDPGWVFLARAASPSDRSGLTTNGILQMLTRRHTAGGGRKISFGGHRLRHGMASMLSNNGVDLAKVQELLGHKEIKTTSRYARTSVETLGSAVADAISKTSTGNSRRSRRAA